MRRPRSARRAADRPRAVSRDWIPASDGGAHRRRQSRRGAPGIRAMPAAARGGARGLSVARDRVDLPRAPRRATPRHQLRERTPDEESSRDRRRSGSTGRAGRRRLGFVVLGAASAAIGLAATAPCCMRGDADAAAGVSADSVGIFRPASGRPERGRSCGAFAERADGRRAARSGSRTSTRTASRGSTPPSRS